MKHLSRPSFSMSPTNPPNHQKTHFSRRVRSMLLSKMWLPTIPTPLSSASQGPVSTRSPPPDVENGSNFSKGSKFEIIKCEVSGQCMFVCIQYLEVADYGKVPKGISYSSPNPRSRGASGEIMAVNKTLGIIYHLLAEKCRKGKNYLHHYIHNIGIKLCNNDIKYQIIHIQLVLTFHFCNVKHSLPSFHEKYTHNFF